jgi:hypothetical protein
MPVLPSLGLPTTVAPGDGGLTGAAGVAEVVGAAGVEVSGVEVPGVEVSAGPPLLGSVTAEVDDSSPLDGGATTVIGAPELGLEGPAVSATSAIGVAGAAVPVPAAPGPAARVSVEHAANDAATATAAPSANALRQSPTDITAPSRHRIAAGGRRLTQRQHGTITTVPHSEARTCQGAARLSIDTET